MHENQDRKHDKVFWNIVGLAAAVQNLRKWRM